MLAQGVLDAQDCGSADALVDRECLAQVRLAVTAVAVLEVGLADSFQGACFLEGYAEVAGDGKRLGVTLAGSASHLKMCRYRAAGPAREGPVAFNPSSIAQRSLTSPGARRVPVAGAWVEPGGRKGGCAP